MHLGIDASNMRAGGGITHLTQMLAAASPIDAGFEKVTVWGSEYTLSHLQEFPWLIKKTEKLLNGSGVGRLFWQKAIFDHRVREAKCTILLIPGGSYGGSYRPFVTMCRNMVPFEFNELKRYGISLSTVRYLMLRWSQSRSFKRADGLVFLTRFARNTVLRSVKRVRGHVIEIPHGVNKSFFKMPREQLPITAFTFDRPLRIVYISHINLYKHQEQLAQAVIDLSKSGFPIKLELIGHESQPATKRLQRLLSKHDEKGAIVQCLGVIQHSKLATIYHEADVFAFPSSCENMPNILIEAMAAGLPIVCANRGPMPEILGQGGLYFDPENVASIKQSLTSLLTDPALRAKLAQEAFNRAQFYNWQKCAQSTMVFLAEIVKSYKTGIA